MQTQINHQKIEVAKLILDKVDTWTRIKMSIPEIKRKLYNDKNDSSLRRHTVLNVYAANKNL